MRNSICVLLFFLASCLVSSSQHSSLASFEVEAGNYDRYNTPVCINIEFLSPNIDSCSLVLVEKEVPESSKIPVQMETGKEIKLWWILEGLTEAGKTYRQKYRLLVYDGKIDPSLAEKFWIDFAYPPNVRILSIKSDNHE